MRSSLAKWSIGLGIAFLAGWGASDILTVERLVIPNGDGEMRVSIGTDANGGGFFVVRDFNGSEVFAVRGSKVSMPDLAPSLAASSPKQTTQRIAQLLRVEVLEPEPQVWAEIDFLREEADALIEEAQSIEQREAKMADEDKDRPRRWTIPPPQDLDQKELRAELRKKANDLRGRAKKKHGKASQLERDAKVPKQRIYAWDGTTELILETRRDLSGVLNRIPARGFFTFRGIRKTLDSKFEVFEVTSISAAQRPPDFNDHH